MYVARAIDFIARPEGVIIYRLLPEKQKHMKNLPLQVYKLTMIHYNSISNVWSIDQKTKKQAKPEATMDNFLAVLGLWRKPVARDGYCLFRAVSEQIYYTQTFYHKLYELAKFYFYQSNSTQEGYFWTEYDVMQTLSKIYRRDFVIYETSGRPPINITKNGYQKKILLCRLEASHVDCVYTKGYMQDAAICQSVIYDILYRGVFKLDQELDEAVQLIRDQNKNKKSIQEFERPSPSNSPSSVGSGSSCSSGEGQDRKTKLRESKDRCLRKVTPPLPYRIAKALDPLIYRNTELDIWEEERREAIHREKYSSFTFCTGDKCQVVLDSGPVYHGHIQSLNSNQGPVIVYIEELGEKKEVPLSSLKPSKSTIRADWYHKQQLKKQGANMPVAQLSSVMQQTCPPPLVPKMAASCNSVNQIPPNTKLLPTNVQHNGELNAQISSSQSMPFRASPIPQTIVMAPQMPPPLPPPTNPQLVNGSVPLMPTPMVLPSTQNPQQFPQNMMVPPTPEVQMVSSGGNQMYPCIWVPFMDSISLRQVNVNNAPSEDPSGKDLPLSDMNTLRFFFNLGVEYYRSVSTMSCSMMNNGGAANQSPIVLCQSKNEKQAAYVDPSQTYDAMTVETDPSQMTNSGDTECHASPCHELDDKRSNASNDSGCESDHGVGTVIGSLGNACKSAVRGRNDNNLTNENSLEKITACSDMSISDTTDHESLINEHELTTVRPSKQRRKYYMYGNLKLIKPIKDIPKRFLNLLAATSAERQRCEGEPIILAAYENQTFDGTDLQCFVPGFTSSKVSSSDTNNNKEGHSNGLIESSSACHSSYLGQSSLFVPPVPPVTPSKDKASITNTSYNRTPFYTGYSNPSLPPPLGTVYYPLEQTANPGAGIPQTYTMYHSQGPMACTGLQQQTALTSYSVSHQVSSLAIAANQ